MTALHHGCRDPTCGHATRDAVNDLRLGGIAPPARAWLAVASGRRRGAELSGCVRGEQAQQLRRRAVLDEDRATRPVWARRIAVARNVCGRRPTIRSCGAATPLGVSHSRFASPSSMPVRWVCPNSTWRASDRADAQRPRSSRAVRRGAAPRRVSSLRSGPSPAALARAHRQGKTQRRARARAGRPSASSAACPTSEAPPRRQVPARARPLWAAAKPQAYTGASTASYSSTEQTSFQRRRRSSASRPLAAIESRSTVGTVMCTSR